MDSNPSVTWDFQVPEVDNLIPESSSFQFSVVADLFGPALEVSYTLLFSLKFYLVENVSMCIFAYKELEMDLLFHIYNSQIGLFMSMTHTMDNLLLL